MFDFLFRNLVKLGLALRYRVRVSGVERIAASGTRGILFLPNHPALIDPVILLAQLHASFRPRPLADADQMDRPGFRWLAKRVGARLVLDSAQHGAAARRQVESVVAECAAGLRQGENILLYPSGHLYRTRLENLYGNTAVDRILRATPGARVVLIRTRGLWGSAFSFASGEIPNFARVLKRGFVVLLKNAVFFTPRRHVSIELREPTDLPRDGGRDALNHYLETFYNEDAPPNTRVSDAFWKRPYAQALADPTVAGTGGGVEVSESIRKLVLARLAELAGIEKPRDEDELGRDLGLDSLTRAELAVWIGAEFGHHSADAASLRTVGDVLLAAAGEVTSARAEELDPPEASWFAQRGERRLEVPDGRRITDVFLEQAAKHARQVVVADQTSAAQTYRDVVTKVMALRTRIEPLDGERIGVMLPASVTASITFLATLFSGKTPVMLNWTTGARNMSHALELSGAGRILTARAVVGAIESQGTDLAELRDRFVYLEDVAKQISAGARLAAWLRGRLNWRSLRRARVPEIAAVLATSGSEALPKAVPLTHVNILANVRDVLSEYALLERDAMIGFLPPFHSFGLTLTLVAPLTAGVRVVYHARPTDAGTLAAIIASYKPTVVLGTPTFLAGILRASTPGQLASLRLAITGAEKCPERTYDAFAERAPNTTVIEGYGITECSPIVSANRVERVKHGTIGIPLPSVEHCIVDAETGAPVKPGAAGLLLVRGPSIFEGYLGDAAACPFVEHEGRQWYRTGDLVSEDADGVLTFRGRLKRFVKIGGEMISLPAIEAVLADHYAGASDDGPVLAVEATASENRPEIVLFTIRSDVDRKDANQRLRDAHLSALHNVSRVIPLDEIPTLGTGKTDYRALRERLHEG